ncbi:GNAT family N-acetyltransferase [Paenibacillus sp. HJL G12]|uniref:GNAT family N-acetyltransferase n=1 Tax=Paenibacillus dendrobii TaxID=2691084 RepID=A0A7X3LGN9_9BACL|nr:GNAT family N-acetyltransferase [Paenibacillus dendrobii]MWV44287.1 GNAT family N-acetyltransferase [Paenibacillus dendrobii]
MYKKIEEYALNAWPALQTLVHDGWLLRFADGYTKRSNSVNAIYNMEEDQLMQKISQCEALYHKAGLDAVFKITPFVPGSLDRTLEARGYKVCDPSSVMILEDLNAAAEPKLTNVEFSASLTPQWTDIFAALNGGLSDRHQVAMQKMLSQTVLKTGYFTLYQGSVPVACGLGVIEDNFVGLFDIITSVEQRNRGYGEQLILNILKWAKENGAEQGYLQVVQDNKPANRLYDKLGYRHIYSYWYRSKNLL